MKNLMKWLRDEESGQGMVEYGLILAGIAIVVIVAVNILGNKTSNIMNKVGNSIESPTG